jgi:hypothetical protein
MLIPFPSGVSLSSASGFSKCIPVDIPSKGCQEYLDITLACFSHLLGFLAYKTRLPMF